jgi:hypothetical protein
VPLNWQAADRGRITLVLFRRRALGEHLWSGTEIGARVRKSRQKEAAGAADAVLMQIEWSEGEVLKLAGVGKEGEVEVVEGVGGRVDGGKRWDKRREVGIRSGAERTGAERGKPCRVFELGRRGFMSQL